MVVVMVAAGVALTRDRPSRSPSPDRSEVVLAVLPFENLSADSGDAYVAKGMSEEVTAALGRLRGMRVLTPSSAASFSGPGGRDRARDEGVTYLIEGSVRKQGDRSRISVRLSDVAGTEVWHQSFERTGADLLGVETEVAHAVAAGLRGELPTGAESGLRPPPTASLEAYDLFLRSLGVDGVARSQPRERAQLLGRAVAIDPSFSQAWAALSQALLATAIVGGARLEDVVDSARAAARRAIALDSTQAEGWAALGQVLFRYDWDWAAAEAAHRRAIALSPNNALAHGAYARVLRSLGRFDEAHAEYGLVAQLDPVLRRSDASRGRAYYYAREYDKALQIYRGTADGSPTFVFEALCQLRRFPEARVALAAAHDSTELTGLPHWGYYYAMSGERARALAIAAQLEAAAETRYVQPYLMALLYTALGDRDAAFRWLERGYREKSDRMVDLLVEPRFDPIRGDPRYDDLLRRLGFTKRP
jgi:serine/threonine-protein kinase